MFQAALPCDAFTIRQAVPHDDPMQFYVCDAQIPSETQDEGYTTFIDYMEAGASQDKFDGFELVARLHMPESGRICIICKAADAKALFRHFMFWRSMFGVDFSYSPALSCGEMVEMQKEHNARIDEVN